jgi:amidophosphoribosyltransferase
VTLKLNPVRSMLEGKRVILIDDSIVRGTTSKKIVRMIRQAGATEVHMRISCPPTISSCYYGVDTPRRKELIAANKTVDEIRDFIGADTLAYLSLEGMKTACGEGEQVSYCDACFTRNYPTQLVDVNEIQPMTTAASD